MNEATVGTTVFSEAGMLSTKKMPKVGQPELAYASRGGRPEPDRVSI
jgi:hypothetical protein